jgi:hypothetical protein
MPALLDTNVLFASASARDENHDVAREIVTAVDHGELPDVVVTNYVVAETLNLTREKIGPELANGMLDRLIQGTHFDIAHSPKTDFNAAQALFRQHQELSFVDATTAAFMNRKSVRFLYTFDDDFDAVDGVTRLSTADNPFL